MILSVRLARSDGGALVGLCNFAVVLQQQQMVAPAAAMQCVPPRFAVAGHTRSGAAGCLFAVCVNSAFFTRRSGTIEPIRSVGLGHAGKGGGS